MGKILLCLHRLDDRRNENTSSTRTVKRHRDYINLIPNLISFVTKFVLIFWLKNVCSFTIFFDEVEID